MIPSELAHRCRNLGEEVHTAGIELEIVPGGEVGGRGAPVFGVGISRTGSGSDSAQGAGGGRSKRGDRAEGALREGMTGTVEPVTRTTASSAGNLPTLAIGLGVLLLGAAIGLGLRALLARSE